MASFDNTDDVFDLLSKTIGRLCKDVTGRKVVIDDDELVPRPEGEFILVSQSAADQLDWQDNEGADANGNAMATHNYQVTYTITAFRGKAFNALTKVMQGLNMPFVYDKYFPTPCSFAYSSSSTISRLRIPMNAQRFENRAVAIITFNVKFLATDIGAFETIDTINAQMVYSFYGPTT